MTPVVFRDATPADAVALATLARRSFTETFGHLYRPDDLAVFLSRLTPEAFSSELVDPRYVLRIGEAGNDAVAFAKLGPPSLPFEPRGSAIELRQFYVLSPWHGSGAAAEMMAWAIAAARAREADDLYLSVFVDNHRARRFYERYGFERIGKYAFMVGSHEDEDDVMRLKL